MKCRCVSLLRRSPGTGEHQRPLARARPPGAARHRRRRHDRQSRGPGVFPDGTGKRRLVTDRPNRGRNVVVRRSHRLPDAGRLGQRCGVATDSPSPGSTRRIIRPHLTCPVPLPAVLPECRWCGWLLVARPRRPCRRRPRPRGEPRQDCRSRDKKKGKGLTDELTLSGSRDHRFSHG